MQTYNKNAHNTAYIIEFNKKTKTFKTIGLIIISFAKLLIIV